MIFDGTIEDGRERGIYLRNDHVFHSICSAGSRTVVTAKHVFFDEKKFAFSGNPKKSLTENLQQASKIEADNGSEQQWAVVEDVIDDEARSVEQVVFVSHDSPKLMNQQEEAST